MMENLALDLVYRLLASRPLNWITLRMMEILVQRFGGLLPREALSGLDSFFFRDAIGNIDYDGDGITDSFRMTVTNAWFDQRITGIEYSLDGRRIPAEEIVFRYPKGEVDAANLGRLEFPPGECMEIIARGSALADGLHLLNLTIRMELAPQIIPILPVLMEDDVGDFAVLEDRMSSLPDWPPRGLSPGTAHVVPHIHYDVEWLQTREVFEEVGKGNLREALRLMEEDPLMTFVVDQVPQLEPFRRSCPEDFERLTALIGQGRVEPVNGMYSEPDTNLISGESLVRQSVAWQRYCRENFGAVSTSGWLIDSFGMSAQLPQVFAKSGVRCFFYSRAKVAEGIPSEFYWEGIDGTRLLTHNMPLMYNVGHPVPRDRERALRKMAKNYRILRSRSASGQVFYPGGVDHGRPQKEYGEMARAFSAEVQDVSFQFSLPSRFFDSLPEDAGLSVVKGEFQRELWGTYSARQEIKKQNRQCEFALQDAGKLSTVASIFGRRYPSERLEDGWRELMDNHFHDQICGCCDDEVASGMITRFRDVLSLSRELMRESASTLVAGGGDTGRFSVLVFNPLPRRVTEWVDFELDPPPGWKDILVTSGGDEFPTQITDATLYGDGSLKKVRAGFVPQLPPLGYRVFEVSGLDEKAPRNEGGVASDGFSLVNDLLRVGVCEHTGLIKEAVLCDGTRAELGGGNRLTLERDFGNLYEAVALGTTYLRRRKLESMRVAEDGPLRASVELRGTLGRSPFAQKIMLTAGSPRIDILTSIDFENPHCRLRCRFPTGVLKGNWVHEIPYGWIERPHHELPAQNYVDISGEDKGVSLINYGIPGNKLDGDTMVLTLLRSTDKMFLWDSGPDALELGEQSFRYSLYPHPGPFSPMLTSIQAYLHNNGPRAIVLRGAPAEGGAPSDYSALGCTGDVLCSVLERSPSEDILVRLWDVSGRQQEVTIEIGWEATAAYSADLLLRKASDLAMEEGRILLPLGPFEIATVVVRD